MSNSRLAYDNYITLVLNPYVSATGKRFVLDINDTEGSVSCNFSGICIALVGFDRQDRISFSRLSVFSNHMLVDMNPFYHQLHSQKKGGGL